MTIEQSGNLLTVRRLVVKDPAEEKRKLRKLVEDLEAIGRPGEVEIRDLEVIASGGRIDLAEALEWAGGNRSFLEARWAEFSGGDP